MHLLTPLFSLLTPKANMNKRIISWILCASLILLLAGCACSKKSPDNADQIAGSEQVKSTKGGNSMDWKYTNETLITSDEPNGLEKIDELYDQVGDGRAQIHYRFEVKSMDDLRRLNTLLFDYGYKVSTFEVLIPEGVIPAKDGFRLPLMIDDRADTRLMVIGIGDKPVDLPMMQMELVAGTVVVRNFTFNKQLYSNAIAASVIDDFVGENLGFSDNNYEQRHEYMAQPLVMLKSHAPEGRFSNYKLKNVSFVNNLSNGLLMIDEHSLGKFRHIELDKVVAKDNVNLMIGIDVSATEDAVVKNCDLTGSKASPTIYQILPQTQVKFVDSSVADNAYGYRPKPKDWHTDPKPVVKENLKEAEGTVFDRVP